MKRSDLDFYQFQHDVREIYKDLIKRDPNHAGWGWTIKEDAQDSITVEFAGTPGAALWYRIICTLGYKVNDQLVDGDNHYFVVRKFTAKE